MRVPAGDQLVALVAHRRSFRATLPDGVRGSATVKAMSLGTLKRRQARRAPRAQLLGLDVGIGHDGGDDRLAPLGVARARGRRPRRRRGGPRAPPRPRPARRSRRRRRSCRPCARRRAARRPGATRRGRRWRAPADRSRPRRDRRPADEDLAVAGDPHARAEQRRAERGDLRARLGQAVGRRDRHAGRGRAPLQRGGRGRAAEQRPAQRRRLAQPGVEQALQRGRHERDDRRPVVAHQRVEHAIGVEALVDDRRRRVDRRAHHDRQAADVRERQRAQPALGGVEAERDGRAQRAPQPVAVGQLDRLGRPARARGVHDDRGRVEVVAVAQARLGGRRAR